jgi:rSAM/selenodomain-associated transferase 1
VNGPRGLVVVGKAPHAGSTKTRLSPPLSPADAADLYAAFLTDTLATALTLDWHSVTLVYPPAEDAGDALRALVQPTIGLKAQLGLGLGAALADAFASHFEAGFGRVVLIGSDNPSLPRRLIADADGALEDSDLVLGPSADGGYYLIGMDRPHLGVFERIQWSTSVVYRQTLERAAGLRLRTGSIDEWYDVDTIDDLARLHAELANQGLEVAPATRAVLARLPSALRPG